MNQLENSSPEDVKFQEFIMKVCNTISDIQKNLEICKKSLIQDSLGMSDFMTYGVGNKSTNRYGSVSHRIQEDMKHEMKYLKRSFELLIKD
ncbi:hypothetical protein [Polynucleobacter paneuropaeus]|uniref:hypothetical protein n=1 Tax=Polynucleobacter paneuropaeus TaxID=2527775 RepID=UPI0011B9496C|nr:hypothetical protein [Polynucleobacter paneuropaeus]